MVIIILIIPHPSCHHHTQYYQQMEVKSRCGTPEEKEAAKKLLPLIKRHHLLLVTLLLFNSISNEALPIFLDTLVPSYVAVLISVTLVLIFGEIIPSALFTGPDQVSAEYTHVFGCGYERAYLTDVWMYVFPN